MDAEVYVEKLGEIVREVEKVDAILKTFTKDDVSIDEYDEKLYLGRLEKINDAEENCQNKILELVYLELDEKNAVDKGRIESVRSLGEELMMRVKKNAREVTTKMAELKPFLPMSEDEKKALELLKREFEKRKAEIEKEEAVSGEEMLSDSSSEALQCVPFDENFKAVSNEAFDNNNEVPAEAFDDSCNAQSGAAPSKSLDDENDVPEVCAESCVIAQTEVPEISEVESCVILQTEILVNDKISLANDDDDTCAVYQSDVGNCPERKLEENCEMCCRFQGKCVCLSEQPEHVMSNGHNEDVMTAAEAGDWKCLTPSLEDLLMILNAAKVQKCDAVLDAVQNDDENSSIEGLDEAAKAFDDDFQFKPLCETGEYVPCIVGGLPEMESGDESEPPGKVDVNSDAVFDDDESKASNLCCKYDENAAELKPEKKLMLPCEMKTDDPLCFGKKSQPPDVAVDEPRKLKFSSIKLFRKYGGRSGGLVKLSRIKYVTMEHLINKKKLSCKQRMDAMMIGKRRCSRKWLNGKKAMCNMKRFSFNDSNYLFCPRKSGCKNVLPRGRKLVEEILPLGLKKSLVRPMVGDDTIPEGWKFDDTVQDGWKRGVNDDAAMRGNIEAVTPDDDMTAKPDLVDPGGWKPLMLPPENVLKRKLCLVKIEKKDVVVMNAALALKIDVHDVTKPSQLMKLEKVVTEVWKVKKCFDRAVDDDNFFSIESNNMTVDYDRANDVVEVNLKMDLEKSRKDLYF